MPDSAVCADAAAASLSPVVLCCYECAQDGSTPLHGAAMSGQAECVTLLVQHGADKEAKDKVRCDRLPSHRRCHVGALQMLLL
jgi:hypothetical protein